MNEENVELKNNNLGITEDDFGDMLYKLALLNDSFFYYKTMIEHDWDRSKFGFYLGRKCWKIFKEVKKEAYFLSIIVTYLYIVSNIYYWGEVFEKKRKLRIGWEGE